MMNQIDDFSTMKLNLGSSGLTLLWCSNFELAVEVHSLSTVWDS